MRTGVDGGGGKGRSWAVWGIDAEGLEISLRAVDLATGLGWEKGAITGVTKGRGIKCALGNRACIHIWLSGWKTKKMHIIYIQAHMFSVK